MNRIFTYILFLCLSLTAKISAQTIALPDANLVAKLQASYSQVMVGNQLDIAKANALTGNLILSNASITDATGIEHFTAVHTIDLGGNNLTSLPDISTMAGLDNLYVPNNSLTTFPDISSLTGLLELQVHNNQLTSLPDISGLSNLQQLYCNNNQLTSFQSFANFPNLEVLVMGNNPINGQLDFSGLPSSLKELHVHQLGIIDSINGLSHFDELKVLFAWGNQITDFSALDSLTTLSTCVISINQLETLPYLENKPGLNYVDITNNYLSFEDLIPLKQAISPTFFFYGTQTLKTLSDKTARELESINLSSNIPDFTNNIYVWKKAGNVIDSSASNSFTLNNLSFSDSGNYTLTVYNEDLTDVVLRSPEFKVAVLPCLELDATINIEDKDCKDYYSLDLSSSTISGGTAPFSYQVYADAYETISDDPYLKNIPAGDYTLLISDQNGCTAEDSFTLKRISGCDPVFSPNGDGIADTYFIEESGAVKIFDAGRNLVTQLQAPTAWDGNTSEGAPVDAGYYILVIDEEKVIYLTLIR